MSKRYKLLKDLPGIPAGTIGEFNEILHRIQFQGHEPLDCYSIYPSDAERRKDWFHDMDTPEPEKADLTKAETGPGEPTIAELLAIIDNVRQGTFQIERNIRDRAHALLAARIGATIPDNPEYCWS